MIKKIYFASLICFAFIFVFCKKDSSNTSGNQPSLLEVNNILDEASTKFFEFAAQTNGDPRAAIYLTKDWILKQETVKDALVDDSTYLRIQMKSGLRTIFYFIDTDLDGMSKFRGSSAGGSGNLVKTAKNSGCSNKIENKKVLIYVPAWNEFYKDGEIEKIVKIFTDAADDYEVTLLRESECTVDIIKTFGNYGFVIIDTHGHPDGFKIGTEISSYKNIETEEEMKKLIIAQGGQQVWDMILRGEISYVEGKYIISEQPGWYKEPSSSFPKELYVTSKYINSLPEWNKTMIFGNMCYSGTNLESAANTNYYTPFIGTAFINRNLISYFGYAFDNKRSAPVSDDFSKMMEDSLARAFVVDGDSTGNAYLRSNNTEFYDFLRTQNPKLWLKQFNSKTYCFASCGDDFIDPRDGKVYKTTCIDDQIWMAENLNYNASGSVFYNNESANGAIYGRLYSWDIIMNGQASSNVIPSGVKGICPDGWHIPSEQEYSKMMKFLGGQEVAGGKLKSIDGWINPNVGATNSSGFSALPGGMNGQAGFYGLGKAAHFWTSTESTSTTTLARLFAMENLGPGLGYYEIEKNSGISCRCVKDKK
jgi:uncharacterized protein (TIGR02145 family)